MPTAYAEVIGDPVVHSKSPAIHRFWLRKLGLKGDYRALRLSASELPRYFAKRRRDIFWRGCNVTAPLKLAAARALGGAGPVNLVVRTPLSALLGANSDIAGIAHVLDGIDLRGEKAVVIGCGGAALAALAILRAGGAAPIILLVRDPAKAAPLAGEGIGARPLGEAGEALAGARLLVNATPLGAAHGPAMPEAVLANLAAMAQDAGVMDMVYDPAETALLAAARAAGLGAIDGLAMLIGQAAPSFELFFAAAPPRQFDGELRGLLAR
ncbi:MAG: shikimate dehydrogenase family protein [Sphingomonadaceae bacterium]